jgi:hypothetical protein
MPIHDWTKVKAGTFHSFHLCWVASMMDALNGGILREGFFALAEQYVDEPQGDVLHVPETERYAQTTNRIAIHHELGNVVPVIEIVSPGNKSSGKAITSFRDKVTDLIARGVNLLVVDRFPPGPRDPQGIHKVIWDEFGEVPFELPPDKPLTLAAYQTQPERTAYVEPVAVGDPLPDMPLFLDYDFYVNVSLEATYQTTWNLLPKEVRALVQ